MLSALSLFFNNANWSLASAVIALVHWLANLPASHYYVSEPHWPNKSLAQITVLDVGTGGAIHFHTNGSDWMLDCASAHDYERILRPYLHARGVNAIDGVFLTHGDSQHIGATENLLADLHPRILIDNPAADRSTIHGRLREVLPLRGVDFRTARAGENFRIDQTVIAKILFPPANFVASTADDQAFVIQIVICSAKVLLMSDGGYATEKMLLDSGINLRSDILIKGQHHSGKSGSEVFLDAVQPRLIVATSRDFPQQERLPDDWAEHIRARGIKLFRQDETGAVELEFGERDWRARAYVTGEILRSTSR